MAFPKRINIEPTTDAGLASPATEEMARGYWAGAEDAGLRAQAGDYRFADDRDDPTHFPKLNGSAYKPQ